MKVPTAKEMLLSKDYAPNYILLRDLDNIMIEFAKLHVKAALEAAAKNADMKKECGCKTESECYAMVCCDTIIDKNSIIDAYSLENIK